MKPAEWVSNHGKIYLPLVEIENNIHLMNFTYSGERYNVTDYQYFLNVNPNARFSMDKLSVLKEEKEKKFLEWKRLIEMRGNAGVDSIGDYKNAILKVNAKLLELEEEIKQEEANQQNETQKSTAKDSIVIGVRSNLPNQQDETQNPSKVQQVPAPNSLTTVLMLTAIPAGRPKLNLDKEHSAILFKLQKQPSKFDFQLRKTVTINDFKEFPEEIKPDILHFSGHGVSGVQSGIVVQNDDHNGETIIPTKGLEPLFVYYKSEQLSIKAVLLNACYSAKQAAVIAKQVPFVIGTTIPINDDRAIAFSTGFYFKLEKEVDMERAFQSGVTAARLKGAAAKDFVLYKDGKKITSK